MNLVTRFGLGRPLQRVVAPPRPALSGLLFPANSGVSANTVQAKLTGSNCPAPFPLRFLFQVRNDQPAAANFVTNFFWGPEGPGLPSAGGYYGGHPYPNSGQWNFEIASNGGDYITGDAGVSTVVSPFGVFRWQAFFADVVGGSLVMKYYFDLDDETKVLTQTATSDYDETFAGVTDRAFTIGDAPWNRANESLNGVIRGMLLCAGASAGAVTLANLQTERANLPDTAATANVAASVWYLNKNPIANDITDKSGQGHDMVYLNANRPTTWEG